MKKQLCMFLQSPEFDVVSVNWWWSAKFFKQEPKDEGRSISRSNLILVVLSLENEFHYISFRQIRQHWKYFFQYFCDGSTCCVFCFHFSYPILIWAGGGLGW